MIAKSPKTISFGLTLALSVAITISSIGCGALKDEGSDEAQNNPSPRAVEEVWVAEAPPDIAQAAAAEIDEASIRENLAHLTGISPAPLTSGPTTIPERGSQEGRRVAAQYMKESFEEMGLPTRILEFDLDDERGFNVEATMEGTENGKHLWVTAHLDSVYNAGASDDASGLVSVLSTARALKQLELEHTVYFVAFDLEEVGMLGSTRYVRSEVSEILRREGEGAIIGNINSDMIGYDEGKFEAVMGTCNRSGSIDEAILRAAETIDSPITVEDDCLKRSDHQNFWDAGLPAAIITDSTKYDAYPWYHKSGDTPDKLNMPYLRSMIQLTAASAGLLAALESDS